MRKNPADAVSARRTLWRVLTSVLVAAIFLEAIFAGAILSGFGWARRAHNLGAAILLVSLVTAGLVSLLSLRRVLHGARLGVTLCALAAAVFLQIVLGHLSARGANLMWLHVPLGVALVGLAGHAAASARKLGEA